MMRLTVTMEGEDDEMRLTVTMDGGKMMRFNSNNGGGGR